MERLRGLIKAEKVKVDEDVLDAVARQSEGCLRDAESLLTQILSMGDAHVTIDSASLVLPSLSSDRVADLVGAVLARDIPSALGIWEHAQGDGSDPHRIIADVLDLVRELALARLKSGGAEMTFPLSDERRAELSALASGMTAGDYAELLESLMRVREEMKRVELAELPFEMMVMAWDEPSRDRTRGEALRDNPISDTEHVGKDDSDQESNTKRKRKATEKKEDSPAGSTTGLVAKSDSSKPSLLKKSVSAAADTELLEGIREKWQEIVMKSQEKNQGLPYMLGVGELVGVENAKLKIGFQYALYRDRLNGKCKRMLEDTLSEIMKTKVLVEGVLVEKAGVESESSAEGALPEGFADLVNDFGGSIA